MESYRDTLRSMGIRARQLRLLLNFRQDEVAARAGVGVMTVQRFEHTGRAGLENVLRIAMVLRAELAFEALFKPPKYKSIDDALARPRALRRRRVKNRG